MASLSTIRRSASATMSSVDFRKLYQIIPPTSATTIITSRAVTPKYAGHVDLGPIDVLFDPVT